MKKIDSKLIETSKIIDLKFVKVTDDNREEISTDVLSHIRNFCEAVMYKIYDEETNSDLYQTQDNLKKVRKHIKEKHFEIDKFHSLLDCSVGHIDFGSMQSEALLLKYIPKLIILKKFLLDKYGILTLENINKYPLDLDESLISFYEKILFVLLDKDKTKGVLTRNQYFARKRSMKYINGHIFYEYVFDVSDDKVNKFNTFVCYSLKNIRFDYDLKLILAKREILFHNTKININIIYDYEYSIRPCTFKNLLYLININVEDGKRDKDYKYLMQSIKQYNMSLLDIIDGNFNIALTPKSYYMDFINYLKGFLSKKSLGKNIIRYLLLEMRNSVIKAQTYRPKRGMPEFNNQFDNLRIRLATKSFELMPFAFNPKEAKPSLYTLINLFDISFCKDEILYRNIVEYINQNNTLFVKPKDIGYTEEKFNEYVAAFNDKLKRINPYYLDCKIIKYFEYFTVESYYEVTKKTILLSNRLRKIKNTDVDIDYSSNTFLNEKQNNILQKMFKSSSIEFVTGSAGTGKTTLIKQFILNNLHKTILCLTTTNTANNNLKIENCEIDVKYKNIAQFEKEKNHGYYDLIIIDEASFISTKSIHAILSTYSDSSFLIVGDPNQIESIEFGNWFSLFLQIYKKHNVVHVLEEELRTNVIELSNIWKSIKDGKKDNILELLSVYEMTSKLCDEIFDISEGKVVLCLNYDGLYGINNIIDIYKLQMKIRHMNTNKIYIKLMILLYSLLTIIAIMEYIII